jgi:hypothetical protein
LLASDWLISDDDYTLPASTTSAIGAGAIYATTTAATRTEPTTSTRGKAVS